MWLFRVFVFFFQAEDGIRDIGVTGVQTCALPIYNVLPPACSNLIQPGGITFIGTQADATACGGLNKSGGPNLIGGAGGTVIQPVILPFLAVIPQPNLPGNQYTYPFSQPTNESYGQIRVDQNISAADSFFARYTIDDALQQQTGGYLPFTVNYASRNQYLTLSESHVFSSSLLNTARFS